MNRIEREIKTFLIDNNSKAEAKLKWLIKYTKSIDESVIMLTDHPEYGLSMGIVKPNGKGLSEEHFDLVDGYHQWCESKRQNLYDDYMLYSSLTWQWIRDRWLSIAGPSSGVTVVIFANNAGDTFDLNTGEEATESIMKNFDW